MHILRALAFVGGVCAPSTMFAQNEHGLFGTWALASDLSNATYRLASSGVEGSFLICFDTGNVPTVVVSSGSEDSVLTRGSCTVFSAASEHGIIVDFVDAAADSAAHATALGTFRLMPPPRDG